MLDRYRPKQVASSCSECTLREMSEKNLANKLLQPKLRHILIEFDDEKDSEH